eukprot:TRINITY_DN43901_c0_g1_i1.p1 TRINITY_DN43901_c0_g1~~TRINITY_DN43901_c0_g1_i1.p1  ORF type:complete len:353 (+),score=70.80 TRINITY_DN43901_c0_g1_i1:42-1061(+)
MPPSKRRRADGPRHVRVIVTAEQLRDLFRGARGLRWEQRLSLRCGQTGRLVSEDPFDGGVCRVRFADGECCCLPNAAVGPAESSGEPDVEPPPRRVRVWSDERAVRRSYQSNRGLPPWNRQRAGCCGRTATVVEEDTADRSAKLRFRDGFSCWMPVDTLDELRPLPMVMPSAPATEPVEGGGDGPLAPLGAKVRLSGSADEVRGARQAAGLADWSSDHEASCGQEATVVDADAASLLKLRFGGGDFMWVPGKLVSAVELEVSAEDSDGSSEPPPCDAPDDGTLEEAVHTVSRWLETWHPPYAPHAREMVKGYAVRPTHGERATALIAALGRRLGVGAPL